MGSSYAGGSDNHSIPDVSGLTDYSIVFNVSVDTVTSNGTAFAFDNFPSSPRNQCIYKPNTGAGFSGFDVGVGDTGSTRDGTQLVVGALTTIAVTRSGTIAKCYQQGVQVSGDVTVGAGSFTAGNIRFGCHFFSGSNQEFSVLTLSEFAFYSTALSLAEVESMVKTRCPLTVRRSNVIRYIPFVRNVIELASGATVSASGSPAVVAHHPVIYPKRRRPAV